MSVTSFLCAGLWAVLWPFMGCSVNSFLAIYKVWELSNSKLLFVTKVGDSREVAQWIHRRKTAVNSLHATAPIASKFRLGNTREFFFPFVIFLQDTFAPTANPFPEIRDKMAVARAHQGHNCCEFV